MSADCIGLSETGSGKTIAFMLPGMFHVAQRLKVQEEKAKQKAAAFTLPFRKKPRNQKTRRGQEVCPCARCGCGCSRKGRPADPGLRSAEDLRQTTGGGWQFPGGCCSTDSGWRSTRDPRQSAATPRRLAVWLALKQRQSAAESGVTPSPPTAFPKRFAMRRDPPSGTVASRNCPVNVGSVP